MAREIAFFAGGGAVVADNRFDPKLTQLSKENKSVVLVDMTEL